MTGGGIPGNLARVLPEGLGARIDPSAWERPPVFAWLDAQGVSEEEQRRVFNLGIGYCAVVPAEDADRAGAAGHRTCRGRSRRRRLHLVTVDELMHSWHGSVTDTCEFPQ